MHGDSLLMLTTKVVSNKKPPLLSDSESGGSTSLVLPFLFTSATLYPIILPSYFLSNKKSNVGAIPHDILPSGQ